MPSSPLSALLRRRPVRFLLAGGLCAVAQLGMLLVLTARGAAPLLANATAFTIAAHLNFVVSATFTWGDRRGGSLLARWVAYLVAISGTALLNLAVFEVARAVLPVAVAAAAGIAVAAALNFVIGDRAIFRSDPHVAGAPRPLRPSTSTLAPTEQPR